MADEVEYSESGTPIYRHQAQEDDSCAPQDIDARDQIEAHLDRYVAASDMVFHELVSTHVHIDIHMIPPTTRNNYFTLVTAGMSDKPMSVPSGAEHLQYAEVMICLPPSWKLEQNAFKDEANYWPLRWLKILARLPHEYKTWLGFGHTVPNGDPAEPFAPNTGLCCAMLSIPMLFGVDFPKLTVRPDKDIHFYSLIPLYAEEKDFKLKHGSDALFQRLDAIGVTELLDIQRSNVARKKP